MQGTQVQSLVREDPMCHGAAKPVRHNYWACPLEPVRHNYWARTPRACAPQQEKPLQWKATPLATTRESQRTPMKTQLSQNK